MENLKTYKILIIYHKDFKDYLSRFKDVVEESFKGEIIETKFCGLKNLPTKINGQSVGLHMDIKFRCSPKTFKNISRYLTAEKDILNYFIVSI